MSINVSKYRPTVWKQFYHKIYKLKLCLDYNIAAQLIYI